MHTTFYQALYEDNDFSKTIGKLVMSSAKLESAIKKFIEHFNIAQVSERSPLGGLVNELVKKHAINQTSAEHLEFVVSQRNYFVHRLHSNLSCYPENNFELSEFIQRASSLANEMELFSSIIFNSVETSGETHER